MRVVALNVKNTFCYQTLVMVIDIICQFYYEVDGFHANLLENFLLYISLSESFLLEVYIHFDPAVLL